MIIGQIRVASRVAHRKRAPLHPATHMVKERRLYPVFLHLNRTKPEIIGQVWVAFRVAHLKVGEESHFLNVGSTITCSLCKHTNIFYGQSLFTQQPKRPKGTGYAQSAYIETGQKR